MKTNKNKQESKKPSQEKIVINSISDLLKIPIHQIHNTKLENFSGDYFDKIYEETIKMETDQEVNKSRNSIKIETKDKILKQKVKSINEPKMKKNNKNILIKNEKENNSINIKHYYEEDCEIPPNKNRIEYQYIENINQKDIYPKDDETQDNDENLEKNDFNGSYSKPKNIDDIPKGKTLLIPIKKIIFSINYNSIYGEEVAILGSLPKLGIWQLTGALPLHWNEGNNWTGEIIVENEDCQNFEFKFIVVEKGKIKKWENGDNNIVIFDELINNILSNKVGRYNKYKYEYNKEQEILTIRCNWH